jgi:hypothetical protein
MDPVGRTPPQWLHIQPLPVDEDAAPISPSNSRTVIRIRQSFARSLTILPFNWQVSGLLTFATVNVEPSQVFAGILQSAIKHFSHVFFCKVYCSFTSHSTPFTTKINAINDPLQPRATHSAPSSTWPSTLPILHLSTMTTPTATSVLPSYRTVAIAPHQRPPK